jgi:hypothetical protein
MYYLCTVSKITYNLVQQKSYIRFQNYQEPKNQKKADTTS